MIISTFTKLICVHKSLLFILQVPFIVNKRATTYHKETFCQCLVALSLSTPKKIHAHWPNIMVKFQLLEICGQRPIERLTYGSLTIEALCINNFVPIMDAIIILTERLHATHSQNYECVPTNMTNNLVDRQSASNAVDAI